MMERGGGNGREETAKDGVEKESYLSVQILTSKSKGFQKISCLATGETVIFRKWGLARTLQRHVAHNVDKNYLNI